MSCSNASEHLASACQDRHHADERFQDLILQTHLGQNASNLGEGRDSGHVVQFPALALAWFRLRGAKTAKEWPQCRRVALTPYTGKGNVHVITMLVPIFG